MKLAKIEFNDKSAQRVYDNYLKSIRAVVKSLPKEDQTEVLMEFNSHIYESIQARSSENEMDVLLDAIEKLGNPEEVLKPLIADKSLDQATRTFNPIHVFRALILNLTNGVSYVIFFFLYLGLFSFIFMAFAKLFNSNTGMYFKDDKFQAIGLIKDTEEYTEVLGYWFIPVMVLAAIVLYLMITVLLKLKRLLNKNSK